MPRTPRSSGARALRAFSAGGLTCAIGCARWAESAALISLPRGFRSTTRSCSSNRIGDQHLRAHRPRGAEGSRRRINRLVIEWIHCNASGSGSVSLSVSKSASRGRPRYRYRYRGVKPIVRRLIWGFCCRKKLSLASALDDAQSKAAGLFPADVARLLISANESDWQMVRWIDPPRARQFVNDLHALGEKLILPS